MYYDIAVKIDVIELTKYVIVGGSSALFESFLFVIFLSRLGMPTLVANSLAFFIIYIYGFLMQKYWTFKSESAEFHKEALRFFIVVAVGFLLNNFFVYLFVDIFKILPLAGKLLEVGIVFFWNYFGQKKWVFNR